MLRIGQALRRPPWLLSLLLLPLAMALCVTAAKWQYHRHVARATLEAQLAASLVADPVPLAQALPPGEELPDRDVFSQVTATGAYLTDQTLLIRNRTLNSEPGYWVTSPLAMPDGTQIVVLRGWLPATGPATQAPDVPPPPSGTITVTGFLRASEPQRGSADPARGSVNALSTQWLCPDPDTCYRPFLQLEVSDPPDPVTPLPVTGPGLGPHLGYAGQWLLFGLMLPVGFVLLLRREIQEAGTTPGPARERI